MRNRNPDAMNVRERTGKIPRSIILIGWQADNERMYPHVFEVLQLLRNTYDEVIYIEHDDRGEQLSLIDSSIKELRNSRNVSRIARKLASLLLASVRYLRRQRRLVTALKDVRTRHRSRLVVAIDHTAVYFAERFFPGEVVFWSLDILAKDSPFRVEHGFLERIALAPRARRQRTLIVQDENRRDLLETTLGVAFPNVAYLPISLSDSSFCRSEALRRRTCPISKTTKMVQNGWIAENRWSDALVESFQHWPADLELHLHGFLGRRMKETVQNAPRQPFLSTTHFDTEALPRMLSAFDIGFVGYRESDSNFHFIENASSQLVDYLRLGIPIIACASLPFNTFVDKSRIGASVSHPSEVADAAVRIMQGYSDFSYHARLLFEEQHDLGRLFESRLVTALESFPRIPDANMAVSSS